MKPICVQLLHEGFDEGNILCSHACGTRVTSVQMFKSRVIPSSVLESDVGFRVYNRNVWVLYRARSLESLFSCWKSEKEETPFFASLCISHVLSSNYNEFWFHFLLTVIFLWMIYREGTVELSKKSKTRQQQEKRFSLYFVSVFPAATECVLRTHLYFQRSSHTFF